MGSNQPITVETTVTGQQAEDYHGASCPPIGFNFMTRDPDAIGQGVWARAIAGASPYNGYYSNTSVADGDNISLSFRCMAGTYTFGMNGYKLANCGILDIDIDTVEVASFDLYAAVGDPENVETQAGIAITAGAHTLRLRVHGKNGASAGFLVELVGVYFLRTA